MVSWPSATVANEPFAALRSLIEAFRTLDRIDYTERINAPLRKDVTPETNFFVALFPLVPLEDLDESEGEWVQRYCEEIGCPHPSQEPLKILRPSLEVVPAAESQSELDRQIEEAVQRIWMPDELPLAQSWLNANEPALDAILKATTRPRAYRPLIPPRGKPILCSFLPDLQLTRTIARLAVARATRSLATGELSRARDDLLAVHRMSSHVGQAGCLIQLLVSHSIHAQLQSGQAQFLAHADQTSADRHQYLALVQAIPPPRPAVEIWDSAERWSLADAFDFYRRGIFDPVEADDFADENTRRRQLLWQLLIAAIVDWSSVLDGMHTSVDEVVAILPLPRDESRATEIEAARKRLMQYHPQTIPLTMAGVHQQTLKAIGGQLARLDRQQRSQAMGRILSSLLIHAFDVTDLADANRVSRVGLLPAAIALIDEYDRTGVWPGTTAGLVLPTGVSVDNDPITGEPYRVHVDGESVTVYSIGLDRIDHRGRFGQLTDGTKADDISVLIPARASKASELALVKPDAPESNRKLRSPFQMGIRLTAIIIAGIGVWYLVHAMRTAKS